MGCSSILTRTYQKLPDSAEWIIRRVKLSPFRFWEQKCMFSERILLRYTKTPTVGFCYLIWKSVEKHTFFSQLINFWNIPNYWRMEHPRNLGFSKDLGITNLPKHLNISHQVTYSAPISIYLEFKNQQDRLISWRFARSTMQHPTVCLASICVCTGWAAPQSKYLSEQSQPKPLTATSSQCQRSIALEWTHINIQYTYVLLHVAYTRINMVVMRQEIALRNWVTFSVVGIDWNSILRRRVLMSA